MPNFQILVNAQGILTTVPLAGTPKSPATGNEELCPLGHSQIPYLLGKVIAKTVGAVPSSLVSDIEMVADQRICSACGLIYAINFTMDA